MERWHGKVAVVTGASSGIGLATAKQLVQYGLIVVGLARRVDQMKEESVIEVFSWIKSTFKTLDILVNNAGIMTTNKIEDSPTKDLETTFKVNVFGLLYCAKQAIKLMKENQNEGHIINVNSVLGHRVLVIPNFSNNVYSASKFAVTALSETLKNELTDSKIRVTNISPGAVKTEMLDYVTKNMPFFKDYPALLAEDVANSIMHAVSAPSHVEINEITLQVKARV